MARFADPPAFGGSAERRRGDDQIERREHAADLDQAFVLHDGTSGWMSAVQPETPSSSSSGSVRSSIARTRGWSGS